MSMTTNLDGIVTRTGSIHPWNDGTVSPDAYCAHGIGPVDSGAWCRKCDACPCNTNGWCRCGESVAGGYEDQGFGYGDQGFAFDF